MSEVMISFARGFPDATLIDAKGLAEAARRAMLADPAAGGYSPPAGYQPLRELIARRHGVACERVLVTNGSLEALHLLLEVIRPGVVAVEKPTYDLALRAISAHARVWPVRLRPGAANLRDLRHALNTGEPTDRPAATYVIPTFQNPTGAVIDQPARLRLLTMAAEHQVFLIEDDPYRELAFTAAPPPTLLELARNQPGVRVIHMSSFSKTICPGVRVGYLIAPTALVRVMTEQRAYHRYICPGTLAQATVHEYLREQPEPIEVRNTLAERAHLMAEALRRHLPDAIFRTPTGGYFLWATLPTRAGGDQLQQAARGRGVDIMPASAFGLDGPHVRLAFAPVPTPLIGEGIRRLAGALNDVNGTTA